MVVRNAFVPTLAAVGFIGAAVAGRYAGIAGSGMVLDLVARGGRRLRSALYRPARGAARGVGKIGKAAGKKTAGIMYRGSLAKSAVGYVRNQARDFGKVMRKGVREFAKSKGIPVPAKRDKDGKLLKGQRSGAQRLGEFITGRTGFDPKQADRQRRRQEMRAAPATVAAVGSTLANSPYRAGNLALREVGEEMKNDQIKAVITHAVQNGDMERLLTLMKNPYAVDNMRPEQKIRLAGLNISGGELGGSAAVTGMSSQQKQALHRELRDVKNAFTRSIQEVDESDRW